MWTVTAPSTMGYGFNVGTNAAGFKWIGHGGLNQGTNTDWLFCPEKGWALFVGLNLSDYRTNPPVNTPAIIKTIRNGVERLLGWDAP